MKASVHLPLVQFLSFGMISASWLGEKKGVSMSSNIDFYSGLAYEILGIPRDLFTPLFVLSRTAGWIAHNVEHKLYDNRIVRPAAKYVGTMEDYVPREER